MKQPTSKPMPLWKIVLLWLSVGIGCVVWTTEDDSRLVSAPINTARPA
ncbi:hypothetical protein [Burkholderia cenocepacia]|nr:hypothetical protein [Burkholderia cenocepacia]DAG84135.1 MAG TPA: hypothetical protein [Caudoviricetes sp.]MCW3586105.1 hypothetical protein [Burkholderia cenocepacia]MCW3631252.1 hypothetical protein [Burkholderia cenocepacia]MCW5184459.1 hypothetical protein [Burkholderia cenocepacia]DAH61491.1 MAG TPA: hypothetical protein [Caudoviricetes sp.]